MNNLPALLVVFILFIPCSVNAENSIVVGNFSGAAEGEIPAGWQLKVRSGKADLAAVRDEGISALRLRSDNSSFSLQKEISIDLKQHPFLTWKWKVATLPVGGDYRKSSTDDQAAQLFLAFSKTRAIVYIWDTSAPLGSTGNASAPFFMSIKAVVVRSGSSQRGAWITETRNVYDDYRKLFKEEPGPVAGIRIQINSQHTRTSAESYFADIAFRKE